MYVDPTVGGFHAIHPPALAVLAVHLSYALAAYRLVAQHPRWAPRSTLFFACLDVLFAAAIAFTAEGATSPAYVFFCFAIIAAAFREGFPATARIVFLSVAAYALSILALRQHTEWLMRPGYLGLIGLLAGSLGQQRLDFEAQVRELKAAAERREIARSLHDGHVQALAATMLQLESCRELLSRGGRDQAVDELATLQVSIARQYDEVRSYIRKLAQVPIPPSHDEASAADRRIATRCEVSAEFTASGPLTEQVLLILLEGLRNTLRHGAARSAQVRASGDDSAIHIQLDDDGVGFSQESSAPWSIASRVSDLAGSIALERSPGDGARVSIELPRSRA